MANQKKKTTALAWIVGSFGAGIAAWALFGSGSSSVSSMSGQSLPDSIGGLPQNLARRIMELVGKIESNNDWGQVYRSQGGTEFSYGYWQFNLKAGSLANVLDLYIRNGGQYASEFESIRSQFGSFRNPQLANSQQFIDLLNKAGGDPVMQKAQTEYAISAYFAPAFSLGQSLGFQFPVSYFLLARDFIQSGVDQATASINAARQIDELQWMRKFVGDNYARIVSVLKSRGGYSDAMFSYLKELTDFKIGLINQNPNFTSPVSFRGSSF